MFEVYCKPRTSVYNFNRLATWELLIKYGIGNVPSMIQRKLFVLASFPGLLRLQFLIACSMQNGLQAIKNWRCRRPGNEAIFVRV